MTFSGGDTAMRTLFSRQCFNLFFIGAALMGASQTSGIASASDAVTSCTVGVYNRTANGENLWVNSDQHTGSSFTQDSNCMLDQYALNNFLHLVGDDGSGHPRFMGYTPWYDLFPATGAPTQATGYNKLQGTQLDKRVDEEQAGDGFELKDVASQKTSYDIRVNPAFFSYVSAKGLYTQTALKAQETAFQANSKTGGIWLPLSDSATNTAGALEIKTSWRNFGTTAGACPADLMHCETDEAGVQWGLVGFHLVQKSADQTAFIWSTFEHIGNAPDCVSGNANPIAQNPVDPTGAGATVNVNKNIAALEAVTGWNYFNYARYQADAKATGILLDNNCPFPSKNTKGEALCLTTPKVADAWVGVNVCRTQPLPTGPDVCANSMTDPTNLATIACLNQSLQQNFPAGLASKWKYYQLVGMEWMLDGATIDGATTTGCFTYDEADGTDACPNYPHQGTGEAGIPHFARRGSTQMANTTMETWMQADMYLEWTPGKTVSANDCFACHQPQTTSYQGDMSHLFGRITQK